MLNRLNVMDGSVENSVVFEFAEITERWQIVDIKGSEKQIAWATSIIMDRIKETTEILNKYANKCIARTKLDIVFNKLIEKLQNDDAKYWIDNREVATDKFLLS